jgi:hypothetical protein
MDDDFAFDYTHKRLAEWEEERREWEEHSRRFEAERAERERMGVAGYSPPPNSIWTGSFTVGDTADVPLGIRVFGFGCHLAELIVALRSGCDRESTPPTTQLHIDALNRDFGNLRELLNSTDASLAASLIDPVLGHFADTLATVASDCPELAEKCDALADELTRLLAPPSAKGDSGDDGLPF